MSQLPTSALREGQPCLRRPVGTVQPIRLPGGLAPLVSTPPDANGGAGPPGLPRTPPPRTTRLPHSPVLHAEPAFGAPLYVTSQQSSVHSHTMPSTYELPCQRLFGLSNSRHPSKR